MEFRYRGHIISPAASLELSICDWTASVHIEFREKLKIHRVFLKPGADESRQQTPERDKPPTLHRRDDSVAAVS
jgi:hypothetical protein